MSSLPTAHASQRFGRRQIEFFAVSGHVAGTEGRARANERRIQDLDGANHAIRLADRNASLEPGDSVAVLRLQSGPERGSRPVSAINYTQNNWVELGKGASASLARTGISRGGIWWFAMLAFMATAVAIVWSELRIFLIEVNGDIFGATPDFALLSWLQAQMPFLPGFDLSAQIPGLPDALASTGFIAIAQTNLVVTSAVLVVLGLVAYGARTWRIVWVPVLIAGILAASLMVGGDTPSNFALGALGIAALFFVIAGLFNRVRDASRLRGRIARLSEHLMRHPPVESVTTPAPPRTEPTREPSSAPIVPVAASAAAMAAVAAAVSETDADDDDMTLPARDEPADEASPAEASTIDTPDATDVDDLPSDADLEAARATLSPTSPELAPQANRTTTEAVSLDSLDEPNDRDMILPPPPPMAPPIETVTDAAPAAPVADAAQDTAPDANEAIDAVDADPLVDPVVAETVATQLRAVPVSGPADETIALPANEAADVSPVPEVEPAPNASAPNLDDANENSQETPDLSGDDPMMVSEVQDSDAPDDADSTDESETPGDHSPNR